MREKKWLGIGLISVLTACMPMEDEAVQNVIKYTDPESISLNTDVQTLSERLSFNKDGADETEKSRSVMRSTPCPEIPSGAVPLKDAPTNYNNGVTLQAGKVYYIGEGEEFSGTLSGESVDGISIYVAGTLEVSAWWVNGKNIRVIVLPTGTLKYASDLYNTTIAFIKESVTIDCWGMFAPLHEGSGVRILKDASLNIYQSGNVPSLYLNPQGGMWDASFWIEGTFLSERPVLIEGNMLVGGGKATFYAELQVSKEVYIQGGTLYLNDCATVEEELKFPAAGELVVT